MKKLLILVSLIPTVCFAQRQYSDTLYRPEVTAPVYQANQGPRVCIDEAHHNFHTKEGRYRPFAELVERDGYQVVASDEKFNPESLETCDILVIANAMNEINAVQWYKPIYPAFTDAEVRAVHDWVKNGGSLFLIADHMPMAGGAANLAKAFGYQFNDGFATDSTRVGPDLFTLSNGQLASNEITNRDGIQLDSIMTFTGQVFDIPDSANPILKGGATWVSYQPDTAWQINEQTPWIMADTLYQGAYQLFGKGKLVIFGEAAMFSAQIAEVNGSSFKAGMNRPGAENNHDLLLNIIHWLDPNDSSND
jgi:uncharacterized protein (DUF2249 family)